MTLRISLTVSLNSIRMLGKGAPELKRDEGGQRVLEYTQDLSDSGSTDSEEERFDGNNHLTRIFKFLDLFYNIYFSVCIKTVGNKRKFFIRMDDKTERRILSGNDPNVQIFDE